MTGDWSKLASIKFGRLKSTTFGWFLQMHRFTTNLVDLNPPLLGYFFACIDLPQTWEFKSCKFQPILGDLNCQFWMICSHASLNQIRWFLCMHRLSPFLGDLKLHVKIVQQEWPCMHYVCHNNSLYSVSHNGYCLPGVLSRVGGFESPNSGVNLWIKINRIW